MKLIRPLKQQVLGLSFMILVGAVFSTTASAFPDWMGVYNNFKRHNSDNPGTFTILMNQDYFGLHAEVVISEGGGSWAPFAMVYTGNADGNSIWQFSPSQPFPMNVDIAYYFHGWDDFGGGDIYDSNNMNNYFYLPLFGNAQPIGTPGETDFIADVWVNEQYAYVLSWAGQLNRGAIGYDSLTWTDWYPATPGGERITANNSAVIIVRREDDHFLVHRSIDQGLTFGSAVTVPAAQCIVSFEMVGRGNEFLIVYTTEELCYLYEARDLRAVKSADAGLTWSAPMLLEHIDDNWFQGLQLKATDSHYFLLYQTEQGHYASTRYMKTSPNGVTWTQVPGLFDGTACSTAALTTNATHAFCIGEPYYSQVVKKAIWNGSAWDMGDITFDFFTSGESIATGFGAQGELYHFRKESPATEGDWAVRRSISGGATWLPTREITAPFLQSDSLPYLQRFISYKGRTHILWYDNSLANLTYVWQVSLISPAWTPTPAPTQTPIPTDIPTTSAAGLLFLVLVIGGCLARRRT